MSPSLFWTRRDALKAATAASLMVGLPARSQDGEIRIGQSIHLSGPMAATTALSLKGQDLAIEEANQQGGINGRPLRLIQLDDGYDAARCIENVKTLIDKHKVVALFGLANSQAIAATLPLLAERHVPLIGLYSGSPALRAQHHPYLFTTAASFRDEVVQMVRNLVTLQQGQIGVVYLDNPFGQLMMPVVEQVIQENGATLVGRQPLDASGSNAVAAAQALAAKQPKAVLMMAFGPSTVSFVKAARKQIGVPVYALSITNVASLIEAMGEDARGLAITQTAPYPWRETTPLVREFNVAARKAKVPVAYESMLGYLTTRVLIEGLRRAGKAPTPESVTRAMEGMTKVDLGGYEVAYGPKKHHGSHFVEITIVGPDGKFLR